MVVSHASRNVTLLTVIALAMHGVLHVQYQYIMQSIHVVDHAPLDGAISCSECIKTSVSASAAAETIFDLPAADSCLI